MILTREEQEKVLEQLIKLQTNIFKLNDVEVFIESIECLVEIGGLVLTIKQLERLRDAVDNIKTTNLTR